MYCQKVLTFYWDGLYTVTYIMQTRTCWKLNAQCLLAQKPAFKIPTMVHNTDNTHEHHWLSKF